MNATVGDVVHATVQYREWHSRNRQRALELLQSRQTKRMKRNTVIGKFLGIELGTQAVENCGHFSLNIVQISELQVLRTIPLDQVPLAAFHTGTDVAVNNTGFLLWSNNTFSRNSTSV